MRTAIALAAVALLALGGCGDDGGSTKSKSDVTMIDWDLTKSHTIHDVDWPKPDLDAVSVKPRGEVRIRLPGGRTFEAAPGVIHEIFLRRDGDTLKDVQLNGTPLAPAAAHGLAVRWAGEFRLPRKPLDAWLDQNPGSAGQRQNAQASGPAKDHFAMVVKLLYSFNAERPAIPAFEFGWV